MDNYLPIGLCLGLIYFIVTGLNLYFHFTDMPLIQGMFVQKEKYDVYINLFVLVFTSMAISFLWPFMIIFCIMNYFASEKKQ
jgi:hypothetical protein